MGGPNPGPPGGGVPPNHPEADTVRNPRADKPDKSPHGFDHAGRSEFLETTLGALRTLLHSTSKEVGSLLPPVGFFRSKKGEPGTAEGAEPRVEDHLATLFPPKTGKEIQFETNPPSLGQSLNRLFGDLVGLATGTSHTNAVPAPGSDNSNPSAPLAPPSDSVRPIVAGRPLAPGREGTSPATPSAPPDLAALSTPSVDAPLVAIPAPVVAPGSDAARPVIAARAPVPATEVINPAPPVVPVALTALSSPSIDAPLVANPAPVVAPGPDAVRPVIAARPPAPIPDVITNPAPPVAPVALTALSSPSVDAPLVASPAPVVPPGPDAIRPVIAARPPVPAADVTIPASPVVPVALTALSSPSVDAPLVASPAPVVAPGADVVRPVIAARPPVPAADVTIPASPVAPVALTALSSPSVDAPLAASPAPVVAPGADVVRPVIAARPPVPPADVISPPQPPAPPALAALSTPSVDAPLVASTATTVPSGTEVVRPVVATRSGITPPEVITASPPAPPALTALSTPSVDTPRVTITTTTAEPGTDPLRPIIAARSVVPPHDVISPSTISTLTTLSTPGVETPRTAPTIRTDVDPTRVVLTSGPPVQIADAPTFPSYPTQPSPAPLTALSTPRVEVPLVANAAPVVPPSAEAARIVVASHTPVPDVPMVSPPATSPSLLGPANPPIDFPKLASAATPTPAAEYSRLTTGSNPIPPINESLPPHTIPPPGNLLTRVDPNLPANNPLPGSEGSTSRPSKSPNTPGTEVASSAPAPIQTPAITNPLLARQSDNSPAPLVAHQPFQATNNLQPHTIIPSELRDFARNRAVDLQRSPDDPMTIARVLDNSPVRKDGQIPSRELGDDATKRPANYVFSTNLSGVATQELQPGRHLQEVSPPVSQMVRTSSDKPGSIEYQALHTNLIKHPADPTFFTRFLQDPTYRIVRDLVSGEQRIDLIGKPRGGYPIFGPLNDSDKENSQGSSLTPGLISALDGTVPSGKRGQKDGEHVITEGSIVGIPRPTKKAEDDSGVDDDAAVIANSSNPTGSSEPDPTSANTNQGNTDPSTGSASPDPSLSSEPNQQIIGAMILPELEIIDPNNVQPTDAPSEKAPDRAEPEPELSLETATRTADKNIRTDDLPGKLAEATEPGAKPSKRRNTKKQIDAPEINGQLEGLLAALFADEHGKSQTDRITNRLLDDLFGDFKREEYLIKPGDTLESIAIRKLKERRLAPLIYAINRESLGEMEEYRQVVLVPGTVIQLPHFAEILRYRIHVIGDPTALFVYTQMNTAASDKNSSTTEPLTYTCRLGDSLTSIAARHPLLQNSALWVLLAQRNKLSIKIDQHSKPVAKIKRGETLILPSACEIESFLSNYHDQHLLDLPPNQKASEVIVTPPAVTATPKHGKSRTARSRKRSKAALGEPNTSAVTISVKPSSVQPMHAPDTREMPASRVITQNDLGDANDSLLLRLEVNHQNNWLPVIEYSVNSKSSGLKLYSISGAVRELPIRLPTRAARELAENDMSANASTYCKKFLSGVV